MEAIVFMPLVAAFSVFPIWVVEQYLPAPWLVEELAKLVLVLYVVRLKLTKGLVWVVASGLAFGVSEAFLYLFNLLLAGSIAPLVWRLALTLPMQLMTITILYYGALGGWLRRLVALILAIMIHFLFNLGLTV